MSRSTINAELCAKMFLAGARNLEAHKEWINELNVFPVPDGDTGTNMTLTIMAAAKEVEALDDITMEVLAKAISSGSLRGARGNSGVILSQLLRGFTKGIKGTEIEKNGEYKTIVNPLNKEQLEEDIKIPENLNHILRYYQKTGFKWLKILDRYHFGGILADDMGLRKNNTNVICNCRLHSKC